MKGWRKIKCRSLSKLVQFFRLSVICQGFPFNKRDSDPNGFYRLNSFTSLHGSKVSRISVLMNMEAVVDKNWIDKRKTESMRRNRSLAYVANSQDV
ncbi:hypothetical protein BKA56DRAFT_82460 [Ilyonectria sp. MPI-CAGE-AT-0026]|nr:hypothetical protein BKA56DRAFT_82460 [Ilyonectria sp. MPI-CAGE-AT-0026]